jgi:hypothetical protein
MKTEPTACRSRQFPWLVAALLGLLILQITGCEAPPPQTSPEGSATMKQQALSFAPPPGKAGIYVIRPYHFFKDAVYGGSDILLNISLDYQQFGSVNTNSYIFALVLPGKHILGSSIPDMFGSSSKGSSFTTEAGKNYYYTATGADVSGAKHVRFVPISETDGQAYVRQFKLSGDNRFDLQNPSAQTP